MPDTLLHASSRPAAPAPVTATGSAWRVHHHEEVVSTNQVAASLAPWEVVVSRRQTGGRGRYGRRWISDEGGLWLSAVVPTPGPAADWAILPLAAGWALRATLADFGLTSTRLRWPNDLMVGRSKLAGILVERHRPDAAVIGIGLNLYNNPAVSDPALAGLFARLADLVPLPDTDTLLYLLLAHLAQAQSLILSGRAYRITDDLNSAWPDHDVSLVLRGTGLTLVGRFTGVSPSGDLRILTADGDPRVLSPLDVELMREHPTFSS